MNKSELYNFTKEEIINALLKRKDLHKVDVLIQGLNRSKFNSAFNKLDSASNRTIECYNKYTSLLKELNEKYGHGKYLNYDEEDRNKLLEVLKEIEEAEKEEERLEKLVKQHENRIIGRTRQ